jgi:hypothetical protein
MAENYHRVSRRDRDKEAFTDSLAFANTTAKDKLRALRTIHQLSTKTLEDYMAILKNLHFAKLNKLSDEEKAEYERYGSAVLDVYHNPNAKDYFIKGKELKKMLDEEEEMYVHRQDVRRGLTEMILIYLIIIFEEYTTNVLISLFRKKPEILQSAKNSISYQEAFKYQSMGDLLNAIGEKVVESQVGSDIEELGKYLKSSLKLDVTNRDDWKQFKEYFYRRHMIVHSYGYPDPKYIEKTGYSGPLDWMEVSNEYLKQGFTIFDSYIDILTQRFSQKFSNL